jgi:hypothetical protein
VLAGDITENRELVEGVGFTFEHGNVDDLEPMLRLLLSHDQVRQAAAPRGQDRIRRQYLWPLIAAQIDGAYSQSGERQTGRPEESNAAWSAQAGAGWQEARGMVLRPYFRERRINQRGRRFPP